MTKPWACQRTGECCRLSGEVVMTHAERRALEAVAPSNRLGVFLPHVNTHFVRLQAAPCPYYDDAARTCTVYQARPMNCRRFACMRDDYATQAYNRPVTELRRDQRRQLVVLQRHAQRWGRSHGWSAEWSDGHP